jgi:hypothetical protein
MPQKNEHSNGVRVMSTVPLMDWSKGWPKTRPAVQSSVAATSTTKSTTSTTTTSSASTLNAATTTATAQQQRFNRATNPEVMGENYFNRTRRAKRQAANLNNTSIVTTTTSSHFTSSKLVQIVQPPPPTIIDLTVKSIEDLMMADQEQKAASDNETSEHNSKSAKGKRKHVATGNPRGRPPRVPKKDEYRDKNQGWHDYPLLRLRLNKLAHVRRHHGRCLRRMWYNGRCSFRRSRASQLRCLSVCNICNSGCNMCECDKSVWCNMTAEEQRLSTRRSEYDFVTKMNKYKKKDVYNYMQHFNDASVPDGNGSKPVRSLGEPEGFINLVKNHSVKVMWTKTHVRKLKVKTLIDSGCSKTIFTDR